MSEELNNNSTADTAPAKKSFSILPVIASFVVVLATVIYGLTACNSKSDTNNTDAQTTQNSSCDGNSEGTVCQMKLDKQDTQNAGTENNALAAPQDEKQVIHSTLNNGYYPDIVVKAGTPVQWILDVKADELNSCNNKFIIPEYGIEYELHEGQNIIEFNPTKPGVVPYACWMNMIKAKITVE